MAGGHGNAPDDASRTRARANLRLAWLLGAVALALYLTFMLRQL